jgi:hypothetical protein
VHHLGVLLVVWTSWSVLPQTKTAAMSLAVTANGSPIIYAIYHWQKLSCVEHDQAWLLHILFFFFFFVAILDSVTKATASWVWKWTWCWGWSSVVEDLLSTGPGFNFQLCQERGERRESVRISSVFSETGPWEKGNTAWPQCLGMAVNWPITCSRK